MFQIKTAEGQYVGNIDPAFAEIKAKYQAELAELEAEFAAMEAKVNASLAQEERLFKEDASGRLCGSFILIDVAGADWDDNGTGITSSSTR